jgi:hypothetical protein
MFNYKLLGKLTKNLILSLGIVFTFLSIFSLQAQALSIADLNILGIKCIFPGQSSSCAAGSPNLFDNVVNFMFLAAPLLAVLVIMWGGYRYFFGSLSGDKSDGKKAIFAGTTGLLLVLSANLVINVVKGLVVTNPTTGADGFDITALLAPFANITNFLFAASSLFAVLVIVWGGYKYMFSGMQTGQKDGKDAIQAGITGLILVFSAFIISNLIANIFGTAVASTGKLENADTVTGKADGTSASIVTSTNSITLSGIIYFIKVTVTNFLIPVAVVLTVFFIVVGAYQYIIGRDVNKGKAAIINAIIGLVVIILSSTIVALIVYFIPIF